MENAIIMASGLGTRMRPLTNTVPKPLIKVNEKPMIETVINGLLRRKNLCEIVIVTGYLKEQFNYLKKKYQCVRIIENPHYEAVNNISSVYFARELLRKGACFICEADLYISDLRIFDIELKHSCYFGKKISGLSDDWVLEQDKSGYIRRIGKAGKDCFNMAGISYFTPKDANILYEAIESAYGNAGYEKLFWDEVVNNNLERLKLKIHPVLENQIIEIDTVDELQAVNIAENINL